MESLVGGGGGAGVGNCWIPPYTGVSTYVPCKPDKPWLAYNSDGTGYALFPTEVEALRYALAGCMSGVKQVEWGEL